MTRRALPFLLCWLAALPAHAEDPQSFAVTTDTPQYCAQLAKQVGDRHSTIPDVQRLLQTGTDMCAKGEVRGGIRRLRHALIILHHHRPVKEPLAKDQTGRAAGAKEATQKPIATKPSGTLQKPAESAPSPEPAQTAPSPPQQSDH